MKKKSKSAQTSKKRDKRKKLKDILKSFIKHPFLKIEDAKEHIHPEIEADLKESKFKEEKMPQKKEIEDIEKDNPKYDLTGDYPADEKPYEFDPTEAVIEEFRGNVHDYKKEVNSPKKKEYEPPEELASEYERLTIKYLEGIQALPFLPFKYLNTMREKLKKIFLKK